MNLVASLIVSEVEVGRYLDECVGSLLEFCDEVAILCDRDESDWSQQLVGRWGDEGARVIGATRTRDEPVDFFAHEGRARQQLLEFTLSLEPTHVLAIDADEFVADGSALRARLERPGPAVLPLLMLEVWEADTDGLCLRTDGGWKPQPVPAVWRVDAAASYYAVAARALACGRVPTRVQELAGRRTFGEILHFGWACEGDRQERYNRYAMHDGGRYHANAHLQSILAPCEKVELAAYDWPKRLWARKSRILERANGVPA